MAGRAFNPRLLFTCPLASISVMGAEQAAQVLIKIKENRTGSNNNKEADENSDPIRTAIFERYNMEGSPWYCTSRLWDDGIIDPLDIRKTLAMGIAMSLNRKYPEPQHGIYRM
jgi:3-methylcrotonyl-CoA carboxylase beta subunit